MAHDIAIVGGGPGGYVAAIRAAQLGRSAALVEKEALGGLCLNWGCIPSKVLLQHADLLEAIHRAGEWGFALGEVRADFGKAVDRSRQVVERLRTGIESLMRKHGVEVIRGDASFTGPHTLQVQPDGRTVEAQAVIIATGSVPRSVPGIEVDRERVITSYQALALRDLPASWAVVGGGASGVEFAYLYRSYGCEVAIVEITDHLLPLEDPELAAELRKALERSGIRILTQSRVSAVERTAEGLAVTVVTPQGEQRLEVGKLLLAAGYQPYTAGLLPEAAGVEPDGRGFIPVNEDMQTNVPGIYAIGDVAGPPLLAHAAMERGVIAAEAIAGRPHQRFVPHNVPRAVYCRPQVASVGLTEAQAREQGYQVKVGRFPYRANGKALALGETTGVVKTVVDGDSGQVLGVHLLGAEASELLGEATLAVTLEETWEAVGRTPHAHPTLSEMIKEAALAAEEQAIHI